MRILTHQAATTFSAPQLGVADDLRGRLQSQLANAECPLW
jgi:hypothetical protein